MPVLGYDMVVKCRACPETARLRIIDGKEPDRPPNMWRMMAELTDSGFELTEDGKEYLCFRHGSDHGRTTAPHPERVRVLKT